MTLAIDESVITSLSRGIELCVSNLLHHSTSKNTNMVSLVLWGKKGRKTPKTPCKTKKK